MTISFKFEKETKEVFKYHLKRYASYIDYISDSSTALHPNNRHLNSHRNIIQ